MGELRSLASYGTLTTAWVTVTRLVLFNLLTGTYLESIRARPDPKGEHVGLQQQAPEADAVLVSQPLASDKDKHLRSFVIDESDIS